MLAVSCLIAVTLAAESILNNPQRLVQAELKSEQLRRRLFLDGSCITHSRRRLLKGKTHCDTHKGQRTFLSEIEAIKQDKNRRCSLNVLEHIETLEDGKHRTTFRAHWNKYKTYDYKGGDRCKCPVGTFLKKHPKRAVPEGLMCDGATGNKYDCKRTGILSHVQDDVKDGEFYEILKALYNTVDEQQRLEFDFELAGRAFKCTFRDIQHIKEWVDPLKEKCFRNAEFIDEQEFLKANDRLLRNIYGEDGEINCRKCKPDDTSCDDCGTCGKVKAPDFPKHVEFKLKHAVTIKAMDGFTKKKWAGFQTWKVMKKKYGW